MFPGIKFKQSVCVVGALCDTLYETHGTEHFCDTC